MAKTRFEEFEPVRLATDNYADRGWLRGRPGHIIEVYEHDGERVYGVEFDDYDDLERDAFLDSVSTGFKAEELELVVYTPEGSDEE